jgi:hypothetical protein
MEIDGEVEVLERLMVKGAVDVGGCGEAINRCEVHCDTVGTPTRHGSRNRGSDNAVPMETAYPTDNDMGYCIQ